MDENTDHAAASRWLPSLALLPLLSLAGLFGFGVVALSVWLCIQQPWLGIEVKPEPGASAWVVTALGPDALESGLALGERMIDEETALDIVRTWLDTPFDGGRHARRIAQIDG